MGCGRSDSLLAAVIPTETGIIGHSCRGQKRTLVEARKSTLTRARARPLLGRVETRPDSVPKEAANHPTAGTIHQPSTS